MYSVRSMYVKDLGSVYIQIIVVSFVVIHLVIAGSWRLVYPYQTISPVRPALVAMVRKAAPLRTPEALKRTVKKGRFKLAPRKTRQRAYRKRY